MEFFKKQSGLFFGLCTVASLGIMCFVPFSHYAIAGIIVCIILALLFAYLYGWNRKQKDMDKIKTELEIAKNKTFIISLLAYFEALKNEHKDFEIIRWGLAVSKPLWLSHKYTVRKEIGGYVETSARDKKDISALIHVLIDDIGWTNAELLDYKTARKNIEEGIEFAKKRPDCAFMLAKGYRHLLSINIRDNQINKKEKCEEYLKLCFKVTNELPEGKKKTELMAEYYFAKATYEHAINSNESNTQALKDITEAERLYKQIADENWEIRILARKGDILLSLGKNDYARDLFMDGKNKSRTEELKKPLVKSLIGLGNYYLEQGHNKKAKDEFDDAEKIAIEIGMEYELFIIEQKKKELDSKMK